MLQSLRSPAASRLRSSLSTCFTGAPAPASGPGPALAPVAVPAAQLRGFKASATLQEEPAVDTTDYGKLSDEDLSRGLQRETTQSRARKPFNVEYLRESMARRPHRATYDFLAPGHSHLLNIALWDALPREARAGSIPDSAPSPPTKETPISQFFMPSVSAPAGDSSHELPSGHHLVYFPLQRPISLLEPDGTDPAQSPGAPFVRRMWAGGALDFRRPQNMKLDSGRAVCVERLDTPNMAVRGGWGREKIFVDVVRRYGASVADLDPSPSVTEPAKLLALENKVWEDADFEERRTLVFMRAKDDVPEEDIAAAATKKPQTEERIVKSAREPEYSFAFTPTPTLLFQFSALSYNAHAIHLDVNYCRNVEGHRDLLVHGPLTLVLMLSAIRSRYTSSQVPPSRFIRTFEYRNIAPLYANEELRVCVRRNVQDRAGGETGAGEPSSRWDVWVENSRGSICARGTAVTCA
ncbi:hypothetical protein SCUCBS95973_004518 [Sporothrix curviconia]|uniref:Mesaconyl-C4 CoA hydratase n=1 Tax=Sporothrix curviconia TaxID=1260050 RepID=A0ABP0BPN3_9PEZI